MAEKDPYPWTRRDNETDPAYDAFRTYLNMGRERNTRSVAQILGKSRQIIEGWSSRHEWVSRIIAYDRHMETASTDGHAEELKRVRGRHMDVSKKLLDHLDQRLDHYIASNQDPSVRWTQAFSAATKAQEAALRMREDSQQHGALERAIELLARMEENTR